MIVTARPYGSADDRGTVVWRVKAAPGFHRGKAWLIRYGHPPQGWTEVVEAAPLEPGVLYELQGLRFVVDGVRIRQSRRAR